jgi:CubicO group peptidase (beta-lactamase class C family)
MSAMAAPGDERTAKVDALFANWNKRDSPGAALAVVQGGKVLHAKGYGMADLEHDVPITPQTPFYIASVAKQFTAFAIARLAQQGKLSLDDDIRKHLPELHDFGKTVTIRNLIHHTSGLRDYLILLMLAGGRQGDLITQKDALRLLRGQRELDFPPGEQHSYSNSNYILLATIVERVTKQTYHDWMAKNVFEPLGMSRSEVGDDPGRIIKGRAFSYAPQPGAKAGVHFKTLVEPISSYGDGNIFCSAEDLARWLSHFGRPRVGDEATIKQMYEPGKLLDTIPLSYAFGLVIGEYRGLSLIGHGGGWAGYRTYVGWFPEHDLGIIILSNDASFDPQPLAMKVADIYLAEHLTNPGRSEPDGSRDEPRAVKIDSSRLDE